MSDAFGSIAADEAIARADQVTRRTVGTRLAIAGDEAGGPVRLGLTEVAQIKLDADLAGAPVVAYLGPVEAPTPAQRVEIVPTTDRAPQGWRIITHARACPVWVNVYHVAGVQPPTFTNGPYSGVATEVNFPNPGTPLTVAAHPTIAGDFSIAMPAPFPAGGRVLRVASGILSVVAGSGVFDPLSGMGGAATSARFGTPFYVVAKPDGLGEFYFTFSMVAGAPNSNSGIMRVTAGGIITRICGQVADGNGGDGGPSASANVHAPLGIAINPVDGSLAFCDLRGNRIRSIAPPLDGTGIISTLATTGAAYPQHLAFAADGTLYWIEGDTLGLGSTRLYRQVVAGSPELVYTLTGGGTFHRLRGVAVDRCNRVLVTVGPTTNPLAGGVAMIESGVFSMISNATQTVGLATPSPQALVTATYGNLEQMGNLAIAFDDQVYVADAGNLAVRRLGLV